MGQRSLTISAQGARVSAVLCAAVGLLTAAEHAAGNPKITPADNGLGRSANLPPLVGDGVLAGEFAIDSATLTRSGYRVRLMDGSDAELTLVPRVQKKAESVLRKARAPVGAIVAMDVQGRILALAGREGGARPKSAPGRALSVWAPAASVFKVVTAAALLDSGFGAKKRVCYHGGRRGIGSEHLTDSAQDKSCDTLGGALARSTNAIFAKLAHRFLDRGKLAQMAGRFGLGQAPTFALAAEPGRVALPSKDLALARVAAGFHRVDISPLQGALLASLVANRGRAVTPRIVRALHHKDGRVQDVLSAPRRPALPEVVADRLTAMMTETVRSGTGYRGFHDHRGRAYLPGVDVAGKTGSLSHYDPYRKFSWFVGFAPADAPEVVVAVLIGNDKTWHLKASTAARMVLAAALADTP